ncbi:MAG: hypothetical protein JXA10_14670 [Anaerolineae bacterium]|nr:hypothetical protein [Anaerolineae bacterium]
MIDVRKAEDFAIHTGPLLALPAPHINLDLQTRQINTLRRNPKLLFKTEMRIVLQNEVDYHRPYADWARTLLTMLARFERRQARRKPHVETHTQAIMDKHLAWQQEQQRK